MKTMATCTSQGSFSNEVPTSLSDHYTAWDQRPGDTHLGNGVSGVKESFGNPSDSP